MVVGFDFDFDCYVAAVWAYGDAIGNAIAMGYEIEKRRKRV